MTDNVLAVIGTGLTGSPLAVHLSEKHRVIAWDRDRSNLEPLANQGVELADSPSAAAQEADSVIIDVFDDAAVSEVCDAPNGILKGVETGSLVVDLSTTSLDSTLWLAHELSRRRVHFAKAPFFGSVAEVTRGQIWTVVGCSEQLWPRVRTLLETFSKPTRVGDPAMATRFKLTANVLTFSMVQLIAEAISLARALDVDPELLLDVIAEGTGVRAPIYQVKGRAMVNADYEPLATVGLARKDLGLILRAARDQGLALPLTEATSRQFDEATRAGWGKSDMARVFELLEPADG